MSSDRIENPAIADMDRHLDQLAKEDQLQQEIEARARKMLENPTDLAGLLKLRDEPKILVPLSQMIVAGFRCQDSLKAIVNAAIGGDQAAVEKRMEEAIDDRGRWQLAAREAYEALLADAQEPRYTDGKSAAEQLLDLEADDGIDTDPDGRLW